MEREYFKNQLFWIFDMGKRNRTIFEFWNYGMVDKQIAHEILIFETEKSEFYKWSSNEEKNKKI